MDEGCIQVRRSRKPNSRTDGGHLRLSFGNLRVHQPHELGGKYYPVSSSYLGHCERTRGTSDLWCVQITNIHFWLIQNIFPLPRHTTSRSGPAIPEKADEISRGQVREAPCKASTSASRRSRPFDLGTSVYRLHRSRPGAEN